MTAEYRRLDRIHKATQRAECIIDRGRLVSAMHHAVRASRIARLRSVVLPLGGFKQLLESVRVAVLQKIARLLPAENIVRGHAPGRARVMALAHEEFKEEHRLIETPRLLSVGQN